MKNISAWAKAHPWPARLIIFFVHLILIAAAIYIGRNLTALSIRVNPVYCGIAMLLYIAAFFVYPNRKAQPPLKWMSRYTFQKSCDFVLSFTGLFMICFLTNRPEYVSINLTPSKGARSPGHAEHIRPASGANVEKKSLSHLLSRKERKALMKELRGELRKTFKARGTPAGQIMLTILVGAVGLVLLSLVGALSCELSCSGNEGAALFVLLLGTAAVVTLMVLLFKRISARYKNRRSRHDTWEPR